MRRTAFRISGAVTLFLLLGLAFVFQQRPKPQVARPKFEFKAAPIPPHAFNGKIRAQHTVPVKASVNGEVGSFLAEVGQDVYEGELLARIINPGLETGRETAAKALEDTQARINTLEGAITAARLEVSRATADSTRARDQLEKSEKLFRRQAMLQSEGATPRIVYEKARREFESAQGESQSLDVLAHQAEDRLTSLTQELQLAKRTLDDKNQQLEETQANLAAADVHSPATGIVVSRRGEAGKPLGAGDASELFRIAVDLSLLEAVFDGDAATLKRIAPGDPASVTVADLQGDAIPASVKKVEGGEVIAELVSPNANIRPGMNCSVVLPLK